MNVYDRLSDADGMISARQLAKLLGRPRSAIYQLADTGRIPHFRFGSALRFDPEQVSAWLRTQEVAA